jgi:nitroreductase
VFVELDDLESLIRSRRSIRRWQDKEVPLRLLTKAIEIATWAPNGGNRQNWRFYIIVNRDTIEWIADEVQNIADLMASWPEAQKFAQEVSGWQERASFFRSAAAAIAVAAAQYQSLADNILAARGKSDRQARQIRAWRSTANTRIQSVASAIAYMLLVLHQMGLGAVWMTGPMQAAGKIERILGVPSDMNLVAFIPVGYPAESPDPRPRQPVEEVCEIIR